MREPGEALEDSVSVYKSRSCSSEFPIDSTISEVSLFGSGRHLKLPAKVNGHFAPPKQENEESPPRRRARKRAKLFNRTLWILAIMSVLGTVITLYLIYGNRAFHELVVFFRRVIRGQNPFAYIILISIQILFGFILFLPGLSTINVLQAYFLHNFWIAFGVSLGGGYLASLSVYITVRTCCKKRMYKKMHGLIIYKMLIKETKKHPYRTGILFNFMFVPVSVKNYLIGLSELKFYHACVVFFPGHAILCAVCSMIGSKVNDLSEIFGSKSFSKKSRGEKVQFIISMSLLLFTLIFLCMLFFVIKRQYNRYQEAQIKEEEELENQKKLKEETTLANLNSESTFPIIEEGNCRKK